MIYVPPGLVVIVVLLIGGFFVSLAGFIRRQKKEASYQSIPSGDSGIARAGNGFQSSYQNAASTDYALPTDQKVVTYCVIDGRLIDHK
jgi:hypothetical protein